MQKYMISFCILLLFIFNYCDEKKEKNSTNDITEKIKNLNTGDFDKDSYLTLLNGLITEVKVAEKLNKSKEEISKYIEKYLEKQRANFEKQHRAILVLPKKSKKLILDYYSKNEVFASFLTIINNYSNFSPSLASLFSLWSTLDY